MSSLLKLFQVYRPSLPWLVAGLLCAVVAVLSGLGMMAGVGVLASHRALGLAASVLPLLVALRLLGLGRLLARYAERLLLHSATFRAIAAVRVWFFQRMIPLAPARLGYVRGGDLLARVLGDADALDGLVIRILSPLLVAGVVLVLLAGFLVSVQPAQGWALLPILCGLLLLMALGRKGWKAGQAAVEAQAQLRAHVVEGFSGIMELTLLNAVYRHAQTLAAHTAALLRQQLHERRLQARASLALGVGLALSLSLFLLLGRGDRAIMMGGVLALVMFAEVLAPLPGVGVQAGRVLAAARRLLTLAELEPPVPEPVLPKAVVPGALSFEGVRFSYHPLRPVLQDVSFVLAPGERVYLSGASGAGKSSIINLLLRFYAPEAGRILVGGVDVREVSGDALRVEIACLSQRTQLLSGSVRDNLLLARPQATDEELWGVLAQVSLDDVVQALPEKLESWIGENGLLLSGGEARRLALAQLLLKDAPIWLLDEPTEGLDAPTAEDILRRLAVAAKGKTILFAGHQVEYAVQMGTGRTLHLAEGRLSIVDASPMSVTV